MARRREALLKCVCACGCVRVGVFVRVENQRLSTEDPAGVRGVVNMINESDYFAK